MGNSWLNNRTVTAGVIALLAIITLGFSIAYYAKESTIIKDIENTMLLTSPAFEDGGMIPQKYTCDGGDINPVLEIQNVPGEAQSLALILHDPDAPVAGGFTHWVVWNIDPGTSLIKDESVPPGSEEGMNGAGKNGYMGPCPPPGAPHHYHFQLYALDAKLDLPGTATGNDLLKEIAKHKIAETELVGLYGR